MWSLIVLLAQPAPEVARLQHHFAGVEAGLRAFAPDLPPEVAARRAAVLDALHAYWQAGQFPQNHDFLTPTPTFVDADDTRCAVAHLLEITGETETMRRIAATDNHVLADDLRADPEVAAWAWDHGLSPAELALIQPSYGCYYAASDCVCGGFQLACDPDYEGEYEAHASEFGDTVVEITREGPDRFRVKRHFGGSRSVEAGHVYSLSELGRPTLDGSGPWLVAIDAFDGRAFRIPLFEPCPREGPYPGPARPPSVELMAQAVLAGEQCEEVLKAADPRWGYVRSECGVATGRDLALVGLVALGLLCRCRRSRR